MRHADLEPADRDDFGADQGGHRTMARLGEQWRGSIQGTPLPAHDPIAIAEQALAPLQAVAREHGIELQLRPDEGVPSRVHLDGDRLRNCLRELVSSLLHGSSNGEVRVWIESSAFEHVARAIQLRFKTFLNAATASCASSRLPSLDGVREHATHLGGRLVVNDGEGSPAWVTLEVPASIAPSDACLAPGPWRGAPLRNRRILVADDGAEMRALLVQTLECAGATVSILSHDDEALPAVEAATEAGRAFDAVILDHRFVEGDASMVAMGLRTHSFPGLILIFATENTMVDRVGTQGTQATLAAVDAFYEKPQEFPNMISDLQVRLGESPANAPLRGIDATTAREPHTIGRSVERSIGPSHDGASHHP